MNSIDGSNGKNRELANSYISGDVNQLLYGKLGNSHLHSCSEIGAQGEELILGRRYKLGDFREVSKILRT